MPFPEILHSSSPYEKQTIESQGPFCDECKNSKLIPANLIIFRNPHRIKRKCCTVHRRTYLHSRLCFVFSRKRIFRLVHRRVYLHSMPCFVFLAKTRDMPCLSELDLLTSKIFMPYDICIIGSENIGKSSNFFSRTKSN